MSALQLLRTQFDGAEPEARQALQEPDTVRPPLRRCGPDGVLWLYATAAQLQAAIVGLRSSKAEIFDDADLSTAPAGLFW